MKMLPHIRMTETGLKILDEVIRGYLLTEQGQPQSKNKHKKKQAPLSASEQREKASLEHRKRVLLVVRQRIAPLIQEGSVIELDTFYLSYEEIGAIAVTLEDFVQKTREHIPSSPERDKLLEHIERLHQWFVEALPPLH